MKYLALVYFNKFSQFFLGDKNATYVLKKLKEDPKLNGEKIRIMRIFFYLCKKGDFENQMRHNQIL